MDVCPFILVFRKGQSMTVLLPVKTRSIKHLELFYVFKLRSIRRKKNTVHYDRRSQRLLVISKVKNQL